MNLSFLEKSLNYKFQDQSLLNLAVTHRSFGAKNNQRLEYLGDAVLDCIIAGELYEKHPKAREGLLSEYRSLLVNQNALAALARKLQLHLYLILGPGEKRSIKMSDAILSDTVEAVIGAIYLDGGFDICNTIVLSIFLDSLVKLPNQTKNNKSSLQEICQLKSKEMPSYQVVSVSGKEHEQVFEISCQLVESDHKTYGVGKSKRLAEQLAAKEMLIWLRENG